MKYSLLLLPLILLFSGCATHDEKLSDEEMPPAYNADVPPWWFADTGLPVWPELPPYIRKVQDYGQRAELNDDGSKLLYVTKRKGEVEELDLKTGEVTTISTFPRPDNVGFFRAYYLANGDYLLIGGKARQDPSFWWLSADRQRYHHMGERVAEGAAISPTEMKLVWTRTAQEVFRTADIEFNEEGLPEFVNSRAILGIDESLAAIPEYEAGRRTYFEPQSLLPSDPDVLVYTHYATKPYTAETLTFNMRTGEIIHQTPGEIYGEAEGVLFTDEPLVMLESSHLRTDEDYGNDIVLLKLDGTGEHHWRLTHLARGVIFSATNPTSSENGEWVAFQAANNHNAGAGSGRALYVMDLSAVWPPKGNK